MKSRSICVIFLYICINAYIGCVLAEHLQTYLQIIGCAYIRIDETDNIYIFSLIGAAGGDSSDSGASLLRR